MDLEAEKIREANIVLKELVNDSTTPANILWAANGALDNLQHGNSKAAKALLEGVKMDTMPGTCRVRVWNTIMVLEALKPAT